MLVQPSTSPIVSGEDGNCPLSKDGGDWLVTAILRVLRGEVQKPLLPSPKGEGFPSKEFLMIMISTGQKLDRITIDPEICLGQPTIRGMRITVSVILKQIANGMTKEDILKAYPELEEEDIIQSLKYAAWLSSEKVKLIPSGVISGAQA